MTKLILILAMTARLSAQSTLSITGPVAVRPGQGAALTVSLAATGNHPVGLQWSASAPPEIGWPGAASAGAATTAATKTLHRSADGAIHLIVGDNANLIAPGEVAKYTLTIPATAQKGSYQVQLSGLIAADNLGDEQPITSGPVYSLRILSRADINGDGITNMADVQAIIDQVLNRAPCADDQNADGKCDLIDVLTVIREAIQ